MSDVALFPMPDLRPLTCSTPTMTSSSPVFPHLSKSDVSACSFSSWYPQFRRHSPKASIIRPLSSKFIEYLDTDGVFLPEGSGPMGISELSDDEDSDEDDQRSDSADKSDDDDDDPPPRFEFAELDAEIREIISKYEGAVFPKLNWSSPRDAAWMIPGQNLKCQTPADVYLLLKSSDFINHDLDHPFDECSSHEREDDSLVDRTSDLHLSDRREDPIAAKEAQGETMAGNVDARSHEFELVLKKWFEIPRSQEWRCFVRDKKLIAISQRDTNFYDFLQPARVKDNLVENISEFFEREIKDVFPSQSFVFDLYQTRAGDRFFIIDFNPYSSTTDPLLFTYSELSSFSSVQFRVVTSESMANTSMPAFSHNRYPKDVVELSDGASIAEFAKEWANKLSEGVLETVKKGEEDEELVGR